MRLDMVWRSTVAEQLNCLMKLRRKEMLSDSGKPDIMLFTAIKTHSETSTFWYANFLQETEQDYIQAASLFKELADRRTPLGRKYSCYYGLCLARGLGLNKNVEAGVKIVRNSLAPEWGSGWFILAQMYRYGYGVRRDLEKAIRLYSKAVSCTGGAHGIANSDLALAEVYEKGEGVVLNLSKAAHHYVRAANRLDRTAQWKAGSFFEAGIGVDEDVRRAFVFFDMCARSGHVEGQRKAGEMYMRGKGVERDRIKAIRLLQEAADRGDARATAELRRARRPQLFC